MEKKKDVEYNKSMSKKRGLVSAFFGAVSSAIGFIAGTCTVVCAPICGGAAIAGPLTAIFGAGVAGFFYKYNVVFIIIGGFFFIFGVFLMIRKRKNKCADTMCECAVVSTPQRLTICNLDYVRMFINWLFVFGKPYSVRPGLYFTGDEYDKKTPLLVTCNFLSTIILLYRRVKPLNVRLLVLDTKGINVWCSASGGRFSSKEIINKLNIYDKQLLSDSEEIEIILPKLSLAGVKLSELRKNKIKPVIGPVYAESLKQYLASPPYKDCEKDSVKFGIKARLYTVVPTAVQFSKYAFLMALPLLIFRILFQTGFYWQVIPITVAISIFYPILFPWLPGRRFAVKGINLAVLPVLYLIYLYMLEVVSLPLMIFYAGFTVGTSIFLALSYTGNSSVSNYSKVKKEIVIFLPLSVLFYIICLVSYFLTGKVL